MKKNFIRVILVHYHEIGLKGKNRPYFENKLLNNIKECLDKKNITYNKIFNISGRLCIEFSSNSENASIQLAYEIISKIPGCARVSKGFKCEQSIENFVECGCLVMEEAGGSNVESFKLQSRRNHTDFKINSNELNFQVGGLISDRYPSVKVQMVEPELEIHLEVIQSRAYVYGVTKPGVGGLPIGTGGRVLCMLSSGIDSPVAAWKLARRGASCYGVHFSGAPIVSSESEYITDEISSKLSETGCIKKLFIIRVGKFQKLIASDCQEKLRIVLYRRLMLKIAQKLAVKINAKAIVTGESLGQVASQTLDNLCCIDASVEIPILRPLVGSDKVEIIEQAQKIETYDLSIQNAPDCCTLFMPHNPETHAKTKYVEKEERKFDYTPWITEALENMKVIEY